MISIPAAINSCPTWVDGPRIPGSCLDSGSLREDVVTAAGHVAQFHDGFVKVATFSRVTHRSAVNGDAGGDIEPISGWTRVLGADCPAGHDVYIRAKLKQCSNVLVSGPGNELTDVLLGMAVGLEGKANEG
jgi:hypothetical protein